MISKYLTEMLNFPTRIPDLDSHGSALVDLFISSDPSIYSTEPFPPLRNSDHVFVSVLSYCRSNSKVNRTAHEYSRASPKTSIFQSATKKGFA